MTVWRVVDLASGIVVRDCTDQAAAVALADQLTTDDALFVVLEIPPWWRRWWAAFCWWAAGL